MNESDLLMYPSDTTTWLAATAAHSNTREPYNPKYACLTRSSRNSASPEPLMTMRPFSST